MAPYTYIPYRYMGPAMHLTSDSAPLLARVRRLRGQVEAIERAIEAGRDCGSILHQVAAVRGATTGLTAELLERHLRHHVAEPGSAEERAAGVEEIVAALRTYVR